MFSIRSIIAYIILHIRARDRLNSIYFLYKYVNITAKLLFKAYINLKFEVLILERM